MNILCERLGLPIFLSLADNLRQRRMLVGGGAAVAVAMIPSRKLPIMLIERIMRDGDGLSRGLRRRNAKEVAQSICGQTCPVS